MTAPDLLSRIDEVLAHPSHFSDAHKDALLRDMRTLVAGAAPASAPFSCKSCGKLVSFGKSGKVRTHRADGRVCPGSEVRR